MICASSVELLCANECMCTLCESYDSSGYYSIVSSTNSEAVLYSADGKVREYASKG